MKKNRIEHYTKRQYLENKLPKGFLDKHKIPKSKLITRELTKAFISKELLSEVWWIEAYGFCLNEFLVSIDLWNCCDHGCPHCLINWNPNWKKVDFEIFREVAKKFHSKLKYIHRVFFTWWELLDRTDFPMFIEDLLKRWVKNIAFISRWTAKLDTEEVIFKLLELKEKYPDFNLDITVYLDAFSKEIEKDTYKYIKNLAALIAIQYEYFNKKRVDLRCTIAFGHPKKEEYIETYFKIANAILRELREYQIYYTWKTINIDSARDELLMEDGRILWVNWQDVSAIWKWMKIYWANKEFWHCRSYIKKPFDINIDEDFNLRFCYNDDRHLWCKNILANLLTQTKSRVLKTYFNSRRDFYRSVSFEELALHYSWKINGIICR